MKTSVLAVTLVAALLSGAKAHPPAPGDPGADRRDHLLGELACVACHSPLAPAATVRTLSPDSGPAQDAGAFKPAAFDADSVPLGPLATKMSVRDLSRFLMDPLLVRPSGRMPSLRLSPIEAWEV